MTGQATPKVDDVDELVAAVRRAARAAAEPWFDELDAGAVEVHAHQRVERPRCILHRFSVTDGRTRRPIVVKVRHSDPLLRRVEQFDDRPVLAPVREISDEEAARREHGGLVAIERAIAPLADPAFGVVRPLALLGEYSAIVMPEIAEPTLRQAVLTGRRLSDRTRPREERLQQWEHAGSWLRIYHGASTDLEPAERGGARDELLDQLDRYGAFLSSALGRERFFARLVHQARQLIVDAVPRQLRLGLAHGDFVPRNIFVSGGRVTVFDPFPVWRSPIYEDLARVLEVGLRLLDVQALSQGLALGRAEIAGYEQALLRGYFPDSHEPCPALRAHQLLLLLDKWSAVASKQRSRMVRVRLASRYYAAEAGRLLTVLGAER